MSIDINKPVVYKDGSGDRDAGRVLAVIDNPEKSFVVVFRYEDTRAMKDIAPFMIGKEYVLQLSESQLKNVPESRWMNIYNYTSSYWYPSREEADKMANFVKHTRFAVLEDKQDGSPFIVHDLREKK